MVLGYRASLYLIYSLFYAIGGLEIAAYLIPKRILAMMSYSAPPRSLGVQQRVQRRWLVLDVAEVGLGERVIALE